MEWKRAAKEDKKSRFKAKVFHYFKRGIEGIALLTVVKALKKSRTSAPHYLKQMLCRREAKKARRFARTRDFLKGKLLSILRRIKRKS